jgi:predicted dehydrogenase
MKKLLLLIIPLTFIMASCGSGGAKHESAKSDSSMGKTDQVKLVLVDPGHFHAALVQKTMYKQVSPDVHLYAPEGPDYQQYLSKIVSYNSRDDDPTSWNEIVYTGPDFFEKMLADKAGNVIVLSGNNREKANYITKSINAGLNVLADKPMVITPEDFPKLEAAFATAKEKGVLLYDIMTERHEVTTILQKLLSQKTEIFGAMTNGSAEEPAVSKLSVHYFSKNVSGSPLIRPAWFFDVQQQGEGLVDITTHLVDLVQWECFSEQVLSPDDINMVKAKRWPTIILKDEFKGVTGIDNFPEYLQKDIKDGKLNVYSNGEMVYQIKGVFAKISVEWKYKAPPGGGDTHYSVMRGTQCDLVIKQGADENFVPTLFIENIKGIAMSELQERLNKAFLTLPYDSLSVDAVSKDVLKINIPEKYRIGHEAHFGQVTEKYLKYLEEGNMPEWEVPNMITKYYTTTSALKMAKGN